MAFTPKTWQNSPSTATPISAAALIDLETRLGGTTYYVATAGNNSNSGTSPGSAWSTVGKVNAASLNPGDTVLFNGGDSFTDAILNPPNGGNPFRYVKMGAYGTGQPAFSQGWFTNLDYVWFENLSATATCQIGSAVSTKSNYCLMNSCTITLPGGNNTSLGFVGAGNHNALINNTVTGAGDSGMLIGSSAGGGSNIADSDDWLIENNTITNVGTNSVLGFGLHGIYCKCTNARIYNNTITKFGDEGISIRFPNAIVRDNLIQYGLHTANGSIGIGWHQYDTTALGTTRIFDNQLLDMPLPIYVSPTDVGGVTRENFVITRNTMRAQSVSKTTLFMDLEPTTGTYTVRDNVVCSQAINNLGVTNGSFEAAISTEWHTSGGFFISTGGALTQDAAFATYPARGTTISVDGGSHSGKVICSGANANKGAEQTLAVLPAGSYLATMWVKGNAGGELLEIVAASSGQSRVVTFTATTTWTPYNVSFYSDGTNAVNISVCTQSTANPTFFMDNLQVSI